MIMTGDSGLPDVPAAGGERPLLRFGCNGVVSPSGLSTSRVPMTLISGAFDVVIRSVPSGRLWRGLLWSPGVSFLRVITRGQISGLCLNKVFGGIGGSVRQQGGSPPACVVSRTSAGRSRDSGRALDDPRSGVTSFRAHIALLLAPSLWIASAARGPPSATA